MKRIAFILAALVLFAGSAYTQTLTGPGGAKFNIKDKNVGAGDSLHYIGMVDVCRDFGYPADSMYLNISTNDSLAYTVYVVPVTLESAAALTSDTVAWNAIADAYPYEVVHVGAQDTTFSWFNLVARMGAAKLNGVCQFKVYLLQRASGSAMASRNKRGTAYIRPYR